MKQLAEFALEGILCKNYDKQSLLLQFMIASYAADNPASEELPSVKQKNQTFIPFHMCETTKEYLAGVTTTQRRCWSKTKAASEKAQSMSEEKREKLRELGEMSMHPVKPILVRFLFVGIYPSVDVYPIFCFEPMHNLYFDVSRMLKVCLWNMLGDDNRITDATGTGSQTYKTYKRVRLTILSTVNWSLAGFQKRLTCPTVWIGFAKLGLTSRLNGILTKTGLASMLEVSDYKNVEIVSPFVGVIIDKCCFLDKAADITQVCTACFDMVNLFYRKYMSPGWPEKELGSLQNKIDTIKTFACQIFSKYQTSQCGIKNGTLWTIFWLEFKRWGSWLILTRGFRKSS